MGTCWAIKPGFHGILLQMRWAAGSKMILQSNLSQTRVVSSYGIAASDWQSPLGMVCICSTCTQENFIYTTHLFYTTNVHSDGVKEVGTQTSDCVGHSTRHCEVDSVGDIHQDCVSSLRDHINWFFLLGSNLWVGQDANGIAGSNQPCVHWSMKTTIVIAFVLQWKFVLH